MASIGLKASTHFNFSQPEDWIRWKRRFDQHHIASGLAEEREARQVSTLLYRMGDEADTILTSTNILHDDRTKYD